MTGPIRAEQPLPPELPSAGSLLNETIVALALLAQITYGFVVLKPVQTAVEVAMLGLLLYACTRVTFTGIEVFALWLLGFMTAISFFTNDFDVFFTDAKIYSLAILSLLYFSKVHFRSRLIFPMVVAQLVMTALFAVMPGLFLPLIMASRSQSFNLSRFGGIFFNAHLTAYFLALAFIYYGYRRRLYGLGAVIVYSAQSKFVFVSYLMNVFTRLRVYDLLVRYRPILLTVAALAALVLVRNQDAILTFLDTPRLGSAVVILKQVLSSQFYIYMTNPFPSDATLAAAEGLKVAYAGINVGNEVALFTDFIQGGFILATLYLYLLLKRAPYYRMFILVSLTHYGYVMSALSVYMLMTYSREIVALHESGYQAAGWRFSLVPRRHASTAPTPA